MERKTWAVIATIIIMLLAFIAIISVHPAFAAPDGSQWGANYFPNVELTTQDGKTVRFYDDLLKGKIVVIDLIYTHCKDMCPLETARLAQVQKLLGDRVGKDIFFYSISIDPKVDTPEVMKAYAEKFHAGPGWLFLTGKKKDIDLISKKLGLYSDPKETKDGHTPVVLLGNEATGQWIRNGATDNPRFLSLMIGNWLNSWKNAKPVGKSHEEVAQLSINQGQYLFASHCGACHTIGGGDKIGPDLRGVTERREQAWLTRFIAQPDQVLAAKDPTAMALFEKYKQVLMPNLRLADQDVATIIGYLQSQAAAAPAKAASQPQAAPKAQPGGGGMQD